MTKNDIKEMFEIIRNDDELLQEFNGLILAIDDITWENLNLDVDDLFEELGEDDKVELNYVEKDEDGTTISSTPITFI
jgi:hypothetical protein